MVEQEIGAKKAPEDIKQEIIRVFGEENAQSMLDSLKSWSTQSRLYFFESIRIKHPFPEFRDDWIKFVWHTLDETFERKR